MTDRDTLIENFRVIRAIRTEKSSVFAGKSLTLRHFIELPMFAKEEDECETDFERWIYVLKNMETLQRLPFKARKAVFEKLEQIVDIAGMSKEDRMKYDESIKVYRDQLAVMEYERLQGEAKGEAKGIANVARNLKQMGLPVDTIAQATGLTPEAIKQL